MIVIVAFQPDKTGSVISCVVVEAAVVVVPFPVINDDFGADVGEHR